MPSRAKIFHSVQDDRLEGTKVFVIVGTGVLDCPPFLHRRGRCLDDPRQKQQKTANLLVRRFLIYCKLWFALLLLFQWFKVRRAVFAERANEVFGERIALVNIATDLADIALLFGFGGGLDVLEIIVISCRRSIGKRLCFGDGTDEKRVRIAVHRLFYRDGNISVRVGRHIENAVFRAAFIEVFGGREFFLRMSALHTEMLEDREGCFFRQDGNGGKPRFLDHVVRFVLFVDRKKDAFRGICQKLHRIDDASVVAAFIACGEKEKSVTDLEKGFVLDGRCVHSRYLTT